MKHHFIPSRSGHLSLLAAFILAAPHANAALTITETSPNVWDIQFDPITFTSLTSTNGSYDWLIFEDYWATNATNNGSENGVETISVSINGGTASDRGLNSANGTFTGTNGALDPNDFLINIASASIQSVGIGDEVVVSMSASGLTLNMTNAPDVTASPTVSVAFWSNGGVRQTDFVTVSTVPEPSSALLGSLGALCLLRRRR